MSAYRGRTTLVATALSLVTAVSLAACGEGGGSGDPGTTASGEGGFKVGMLFSQNVQPRWEDFDRPLIEKKIKDLCADCTMEYANAKDDVATQHQQMRSWSPRGSRS